MQQRLAPRKTAKMEITGGMFGLGRLRKFPTFTLGANQWPITPLTLAVSVTDLQPFVIVELDCSVPLLKQR